MSENKPAVPPANHRRVRLVESAPPHGFAGWKWLAAAPALVALTTSVAMACVLAMRSPSDILPWYQEQADQALADHNYQLASVCYQRLATDEPGDPGNDFKMALSLAGAGRQHEAAQILARLTPSDEPGYPPARLFLAQQLLAASSRTQAMTDRAETNLLQVVKAEPMNETAHALLATLYAGEAKWALCKYHLARSGTFRDPLQAKLLPGGDLSHGSSE
jgi:predicted Zn-dependent protease